jgi:hypothetical protein
VCSSARLAAEGVRDSRQGKGVDPDALQALEVGNYRVALAGSAQVEERRVPGGEAVSMLND